MVPRRQRTRVVLDTNVFVRALLNATSAGSNQRIVRLWLIQRRLQLVVCDAVVEEYLGVFDEVLRMSDKTIAEWASRFSEHPLITSVRLGWRVAVCRDPDDDLFLATAIAGRAAWLITNDKDLLEIPSTVIAPLGFRVARPSEFLADWSATQ